MSRAMNAVTQAVHHKVFDLQLCTRRVTAAAQNGANSRSQFREGKWFGHQVVRACVQAPGMLVHTLE